MRLRVVAHRRQFVGVVVAGLEVVDVVSDVGPLAMVLWCSLEAEVCLSLSHTHTI